MDTTWSLCVFKADPGIRLGLSFHAARERATLTRVDPEGAAAGSGLEPGDVILEIDGQPVTSALAAASILRGLEGSIELEVLRPAKRTAGQGFASTPAQARAAVAIQAAWRGYDTRLAILFWEQTATLIQAAWRGTLTRWDVADWLNYHSVVRIQKVWRGRKSRLWTCQLRQAARSATPEREQKPDKRQVNIVRRALSFNRKPRRRGLVGLEFGFGVRVRVRARARARARVRARARARARARVRS